MIDFFRLPVRAVRKEDRISIHSGVGKNHTRIRILTDITSCLKTESEETEMTAIEKVMMNVEGKFWTRQNEMVEELEELDYEVTAINYEYAAVVDTQDEDEREYILYLGHANTTMWVESAKEVA